MGASTVDVTGETYRGTPFGLGPRVPMIVVSPWTVGGFVNSQVFDHTSVIRFLEVRFGVREPNISAWRRVVSGDLVSVFDFTQTGGAGSLPKGDDGIARADAQAKLPTARHVDEALPRQEPGQRPARALPYNLDVIANFGGAGSTLVFYNTGRAGAVFRVSSARIGEGPWFFTLESGTSLEHRLDPNSSYDLTVHGPNGFFRRFAGPVDSPLQMALHHNGSGELQIIVRNTGVADAVLSAQDGYAPDVPMNAAISPGTVRRLHLPSASRANWYDIKIDGPDGFLRHFAGHIETGAASMSDPHLG
jgi:phospholipase C